MYQKCVPAALRTWVALEMCSLHTVTQDACGHVYYRHGMYLGLFSTVLALYSVAYLSARVHN